MKSVLRFAFAFGLVAAAVPAADGTTFSGNEDLIRALARSRHSLAEGIRQVAHGPEFAISAKFELNEEGQLMLSVYTAERGRAVDAEGNVLKEYNGSPEGESWTPATEVFQDVAHVSRASQQLTQLAMTRLTLLDVLERAQRDAQGTIVSVTPGPLGGVPHFVVTVAQGDALAELRYELRSGWRLRQDRDGDDDDDDGDDDDDRGGRDHDDDDDDDDGLH